MENQKQDETHDFTHHVQMEAPKSIRPKNQNSKAIIISTLPRIFGPRQRLLHWEKAMDPRLTTTHINQIISRQVPFKDIAQRHDPKIPENASPLISKQTIKLPKLLQETVLADDLPSAPIKNEDRKKKKCGKHHHHHHHHRHIPKDIELIDAKDASGGLAQVALNEIQASHNENEICEMMENSSLGKIKQNDGIIDISAIPDNHFSDLSVEMEIGMEGRISLQTIDKLSQDIGRFEPPAITMRVLGSEIAEKINRDIDVTVATEYENIQFVENNSDVFEPLKNSYSRIYELLEEQSNPDLSGPSDTLKSQIILKMTENNSNNAKSFDETYRALELNLFSHSTYLWTLATTKIKFKQRTCTISDHNCECIKLTEGVDKDPELGLKIRRALAIEKMILLQQLGSSLWDQAKSYELFMHLPCINELKPTVQYALANVCSVRRYPAGKVIFRETNRIENFYIILLGICVEYKSEIVGGRRHQFQKTVRAYFSGECISDMLGNTLARRSSSVIALTSVILITISKQDWLAAMRKGYPEVVNLDILASLPQFSNVPSDQLVEMCKYCLEVKIPPNEVILEPLEEIKSIYFISKGTCSVSINIPFVKTVKDRSLNLVAPAEFQVIPYYGQRLQPEKDELVYVEHSMNSLSEGNFFPPVIKDVRETFKTHKFISEQNLVCLCFPMAYAMKTFPETVKNSLKAMNESVYLNDFRVRELQEHYLSTKGWRNDTESAISKVLATEIEHERQQHIEARYIARQKKKIN